ncbi:MAG: 23S rRNA (adenine(2503)-C(2))-methyltransferase RlmN [Chloroflexota bacterium]
MLTKLPKEFPDQLTLKSLLDLSFDELTDYLVALGQPAFRAKQLWEWIYKHHAGLFSEMGNLPKPLRTHLEQEATIAPLVPITEVISKAGDTQKVLFRLHDGHTVEAVLMVYDKRRTLCISSQAGCAMGCTFCATAIGGLARNLSVGEIVAQVLYFARYLSRPEQKPSMSLERPTQVTNVVFMGMGEPMHNYRNVWQAIRLLTDQKSFGLGARHITLSTVGLVPMIDRMADENLQVGLAVSLHAPNDQLRSQLVPINTRYPVDDVLASVRRYVDKTNRRVTFEYALMQGINDSLAMALELSQKLKGLLCHVNLIPLNPVPDSLYQPTSDGMSQHFLEVLQDKGISATIRLRRGIEINAGCGQLQQAVQNHTNGQQTE